MNKLLQKNKDLIVILVWLVPFILSFALINENFSRSLVIIVFLLVWLAVYLKGVKKSFNSILLLIAFSAFNITLTLGDLDSCYKNGVYVNYLCPTLHITDIFLILSLVVSTLNNKTYDLIKYSFIILPILTYSIIHIISHPNFNTLIGTSRIFFATVLLIISYMHIKEGLLSKKSIFLVASITLIVQLVISLFQFILRRDLGLQFLGESTILAGTINSSFVSFPFGEYLRSYGTFPHPNVLAGFVLALTLFSFKVFKFKDWRFWVVFILSLTISLLTLSRLHIFLLFTFILIQSLKPIKERYFSFLPIIYERFTSLGGNAVSIKERLILIKESLRIVKDNWLLGVGNGELVRYLDNNVRTNSNISLFQPVHNIPMLILAEHGIFGFITYILYFLYIVFRNNRGFNQVTTILFILVCVGLFDHYLVTLPQGLMIGILFLL